MRTLLTLLIVIAFYSTSSAQSNHFSSLRLTTHFDFLLKVPGLDDAGFGLQADGALFAQHKFHLVASANAERLIGDKSLYIGPMQGRINKPGTIYGVQAGPEYFLVPHVALSAQYGVFWHSINEYNFDADQGFKFSLTLLPGKSKSFVVNLSRTIILIDARNLRYYSFGVGYTFF